MANETKKRLLLSKWRCTAEVFRDVENSLQEKIADRDSDISRLKEEIEETKEQLESLQSDRDEHSEQIENTLLDVKYWMLGVLVHHQPMSDPRVILRKVEDVLG